MQLQSSATGQLIVTMGSHPTCREGMCIGTNGIVRFDIMHGMIGRKLSDSSPMDWQTFGGTSDSKALERAYFDEINCFVDCIQGKAQWPLDYRYSAVATATLAACEASAKSQRAEPVDLQRQPGIFPA
jgi:predicted dehydrogenase